jgi:hypothetical protein
MKQQAYMTQQNQNTRSTTQKSMLDYALEYLDQGFSVIPVKQDKTPYIKWDEFTKRHPTQEEIEQWFTQWPNANIAIICGKISGIYCIDADSKQGIEWVNTNLPTTSVYSKTYKGCHCIFLVPKNSVIGNKVRIAPDVDIRGEGGYFVAPPSIHASGHVYQWVFPEGMNGWDDLTEYQPPTAKLTQFTDDGNINIDLTLSKTKPAFDGVPQGSRNATLTQLVGRWIAKGLDDDEIIELAFAINSKNQPPLPDKEVYQIINSVKKTHVRNHQTETPEIKPEKIIQKNTSIPEYLLNTGGILQELIDYIEENSPVAIPIFSLAASLSFLGSIIGQKFMTETGLRTNLYCIALGYSGTGKNAPFDTLQNLITKTTAYKILGPTELTSAASIYSWLANVDRHNTWMALDEIGHVLKGLQNPKAPEAGIPRMLTKLFSATNKSETKPYANSDHNIEIPWMHLGFYGASTPERFWSSITPGEVADGFLARILLFEHLDDAPLPKTHINYHVPPAIISKLSSLYDTHIEWEKEGNNPKYHRPIPNIVYKTPDAVSQFNDWAIQYHHLQNKHKKNTLGISSIYGRAAEHAHKIALIHAVSLEKSTVGIESVSYACDLIDHITSNLIFKIESNVADTDIARWKNKIIQGIRAYTEKNSQSKGYAGASLRDLQRGPAQGLKKKELQDIIDSLILAERIGISTIKAKNGADVSYYYVAE